MIEVIVKEGIVKKYHYQNKYKNHYSIRFSDDTFEEDDGNNGSYVSSDRRFREIIVGIHSTDEFRRKWNVSCTLREKRFRFLIIFAEKKSIKSFFS